MNLMSLTAVELGKKIKSGEVTAVEVQVNARFCVTSRAAVKYTAE